MWLFSFADFSLSKLAFSVKSFGNSLRVPNGSDPDQDRYNVGLGLGPNCLKRLSAGDRRNAINSIFTCAGWLCRI